MRKKPENDSPYQDQRLILATEVGTLLDAQNIVNHSFKPLLKELGFRQSGSTTSGTPARRCSWARVCSVQETLRHASISLTLDTYSHVLPDMQSQTVSAVDALLE